MFSPVGPADLKEKAPPTQSRQWGSELIGHLKLCVQQAYYFFIRPESLMSADIDHVITRSRVDFDCANEAARS